MVDVTDRPASEVRRTMATKAMKLIRRTASFDDAVIDEIRMKTLRRAENQDI